MVEGVVYLPSGVSTLYHGRQLALVLQWLVHYELLHDPDVEAVGPTSILLDDLNEPLPDATLFRIRADRFEGGYIKGAPS